MKMLRKTSLLFTLLIAAIVTIGVSTAAYLQKIGCYNQRTIKGLTFLFSNRGNIDWKNGDFRQFVKSLAFKCKTVSQKRGHTMFALVFYGECWGIKSASQLSNAIKDPNKCTLGDNTYSTCNGEKDTLCVGGSGTAYVYTSIVPKCPLFLFRKMGCFDSRTYPISVMKQVSNKKGHGHGHKHKRPHDVVYKYGYDIDLDIEYNDPKRHGRVYHSHGHHHPHGKKPTMSEILCYCSEEALRGEYTYFSIRSFTRCMLGDHYNDMITATSKGRSRNCYNEQGRICNDKDSSRCVGGNGADYVYMIDFCLIYNGGCQHYCSFNGVTKSVTCSCKTGFVLAEDSRTCTDINECRTKNKGGCTHTCVNTAGSYQCSCPSGYILLQDQRTCQDINECERNTDGCQQTCINLKGNFKCGCKDGYLLTVDEKTCKDVDECLTSSHGCEDECVNMMGSYRCKCKNGYQLDANGKTCSDIDECLAKNGGCTDKCINFKGGFNCTCKEGFQLLGDDKTCEDINECKTVEKGGCHHKCSNFKGGFECLCLPGYQLASNGKNCTDIDECENLNGGCSHVCTNSEGSFKCSCPKGLTLDGKQCYDIDECTEPDKGGCAGDCVNLIGSFYCTCGKGYVLHANNKTCQDENECLRKPKVCTQKCENTIGSFTCSCKDGYQLDSDNKTCVDEDECSRVPKVCSQKCLNSIGSYACSCDVDYQLGSDNKTCIAKQTKWPRGSYGILSREKCPPGWFEFTHCLDTQDFGNADNMHAFTLGFYPSNYAGNTKCAKSFVTFRYCFKGPNVPSRAGGFWTKTGATGEGYVIKNTLENKESDCSIFGREGGSVQLDTEDFWNKDTYGNNGLNEKYYPQYYPNGFNFGDLSYVRLQFCRIGEAEKFATLNVMEIGEFPNEFGFFIHRDATCPVLKGPSGYLRGHREEFTMDFEDSFNTNIVIPPAPFEKVGKGNFNAVVCQYDPKKGNASI